ncbi:hypothetical protein HIM_03298 [Hirsutella minnesotensis 3608]|nr:hypothetical protein HIM_03298 [Hirsutella minnesotensis 3608]
MSQVKNLRAMFENKGDKSPPDRGRSPGVSASTTSSAGAKGSVSPRPLSKVRTNFVAIEKDGRIGLRRDPSGESSLSRRRMSGETDVESTATFTDKPIFASTHDGSQSTHEQDASEARTHSPERPFELENTADATKPVPLILRTSDDGTQTKTEPSGNPQPAVTAVSAVTKSKALDPVSLNKGRKEEVPQTKRPVSSSTPTLSRSAQIAPSPSATARPTAKEPTLPASPLGPPKRDSSNPAKKATGKQVEHVRQAKAATTVQKTRPLSPKPHRLKGPSSGESGFIKPKPKSPTKPVNLPSSLTAPTASSVSRESASRNAAPKQTGGTHHPIAPSQALARSSSSRASARNRALTQPKSTTSRPKPSVGPPPSKPFDLDRNIVKRPAHIDESFLARMTRPTQSSSSKAAERSPSTPPKSGVSRSSGTVKGSSPQHASSRRLPRTTVLKPVENLRLLVSKGTSDPRRTTEASNEGTDKADTSVRNSTDACTSFDTVPRDSDDFNDRSSTKSPIRRDEDSICLAPQGDSILNSQEGDEMEEQLVSARNNGLLSGTDSAAAVEPGTKESEEPKHEISEPVDLSDVASPASKRTMNLRKSEADVVFETELNAADTSIEVFDGDSMTKAGETRDDSRLETEPAYDTFPRSNNQADIEGLNHSPRHHVQSEAPTGETDLVST